MSNQPPPVSLSLPDGSLDVNFRWVGDRYVHEIRQSNGASLCEHIEGEPSDWPAAPPIQQLSLEEISGSPVALGVGLAGKSHWSISVEIAKTHEHACLVFDCACRVKETPQFLGSAYAAPDRAVLGAFEFQIDQGLGVMRETENSLQIVPATAVDPGKTARWRYRVSIKKPT